MRSIESIDLSEFLTGILSLTKSIFTAWGIAQILSGGVAFYGIGAVLAPFMARERALIPMAVFTVVVPTSFAIMAAGWYRLCWKREGIPRPDLNLVIGSVAFMPLYFEATSLFIHKPRPLIPGEIIEDLLVYYLSLPFTLTLMSGYTGTLLGLGATIVATLVTGEAMRGKGLRRGLTCDH
jgi:hypothetical protein